MSGPWKSSVAALLFAAACSVRGEAGGPSSEPAPEQHVEARHDALEEPRVVEASPVAVSPTLAALAAEEEWGVDVEAGPVPSGARGGLVTWADQAIERGDGGISRVRLVGVPRESDCTWRLAFGVAEGWIQSIELGQSATGCRLPLDRQVIEGGWDFWFPLAWSADRAGVRVEGQGLEPSPPLVEDEVSPLHPTPIPRVVHLCRIEGAAVACVERSGTGRLVRGTLAAVARTGPMAPEPPFAPLAQAATAGRGEVARWILGPAADPALARALADDVSTRVEDIRVAPGVRVIVTSDDDHAAVFLARGGVVHRIADAYSDYDNERVVCEGVDTEGDVVRVRMARVNAGGATVTWRWDELVSPVWQARLATGVTIAVAGEAHAGWTRRVAVTPRGVSLTEGEGALAWFRGTGSYTWEELEVAATRWRRQLAGAMAATPREPSRPVDELGKLRRASLTLVSGFVEPIDRTVVDQVRRHGL